MRRTDMSHVRPVPTGAKPKPTPRLFESLDCPPSEPEEFSAKWYYDTQHEIKQDAEDELARCRKMHGKKSKPVYILLENDRYPGLCGQNPGQILTEGVPVFVKGVMERKCLRCGRYVGTASDECLEVNCDGKGRSAGAVDTY